MNGKDVYTKLTNQYNGILLKHKGSLFVNNLYCDRDDKESREYYRKLARVIKEKRTKRYENPSRYPDERIMSPFIDIAAKWLVVHAPSRKGFPLYFKRQFKMNSLESKVKGGKGEEKNTFTIKPQETKSVETILFYDKITGKFKFGILESEAISKTSRHKVRNVTEKLMKCWRKGHPCPLSEFGIDPTKKTPTLVYDNISDIRKVLKDIKVNMPQGTEGAYSPPSEPEHFDIINKS